MREELADIRARLNLSGISRGEAARALYLSVSGLNRKLRGELGLTRQEKDALLQLCAKRRGQRIDRQGDA